MNFCLNFPLFLLVLSLLFAVISPLLKRSPARILSIVLTFLSFAANLVIYIYTLRTGESYTYMMGHYPHPWGNELRIGLVESLFSSVFSLILLLTLIGGRKTIDLRVSKGKGPLYYCMCDLVQAALLALVYTNDLFTG
ncbi:MAG: sodium:proton antiporter, partial [Lachnospiraceae bacterium]|nr:sodium:proton antiporter [Lachnospiraceae bacterium]